MSVVEPVCLPSVPDDLDGCLSVLVEGFRKVKGSLMEEPVAISFAFPGPADYEHGVIGDLPNFPAFCGGVALGPFWKKSLVFPFLSIMMAICLLMVKLCLEHCHNLIMNLKRLEILNAIEICWELLWVLALGQVWLLIIVY